jgi:hypothetical protein
LPVATKRVGYKRPMSCAVAALIAAALRARGGKAIA